MILFYKVMHFGGFAMITGVFHAYFLATALSQPILPPATTQVFQSHEAAPEGFLRNVCQLSVTRRNLRTGYIRRVPFYSSAVLYRDRYLVTAAHNVHSTPFSFLLNVSITCGAADVETATPQAVVGRSAVHVLPGYSFIRPYPARYERDVAIVRLPRPICTGVSVGIGDPGIAQNHQLFIAGFPAEKGDGGGMNGKRMYRATGQLLARPSQPYLLIHNFVTEGGNSGGPVWISQGENHTLVGVHVGENGSARVIGAELRDELNQAIDRLETGSPTPLAERCPGHRG